MPELPEWRPLRGVTAPVSDDGGAGRIVALVASEQAVVEGWAASSALALARSWSQTGSRVMLVDGVLHEPSLHHEAGVPNVEGLTDATLYGASVGRVARPLDDGNLFLISAGTPVADTQSVIRNPRWHRLTGAMTEAGVLMALLTRDGEAATCGFLGSASDIVVLAAPGDVVPSSVQDLEPLVHAVTGPESGLPRRKDEPDLALSTGLAARRWRLIGRVLMVISIVVVLGLIFSGIG